MSLNHVGINAEKFEEAKTFYTGALKPLGYKVAMTFQDGNVVGMASGFGPDFWITSPAVPPHQDMLKDLTEEEASKLTLKPTGYIHIAFTAKNRKQVRQFYEAALAAGGKCNGKPGLRPQYFSTYYGAFVLDPEGRNIEAVCMKPGFWAEEWGVIGWGVAGLLASGVGYGAGLYFGLL